MASNFMRIMDSFDVSAMNALQNPGSTGPQSHVEDFEEVISVGSIIGDPLRAGTSFGTPW